MDQSSTPTRFRGSCSSTRLLVATHGIHGILLLSIPSFYSLSLLFLHIIIRDSQTSYSYPGIVSTCRADANNLLLVYLNKVDKLAVASNTVVSTVVSGHSSLSACTVDKGGNIYVSETGG